MCPHRVVVLLVAPVVGFDAVIPPQLFGSARGPAAERLYDVALASVDGSPVATEHGYELVPTADAGALRHADTVIVPGTKLRSARRQGQLDDEVRTALAGVRPGARVMSICTGAFVLAAAGLLDGRPATTHWAYADEFRRLYPRVRLDETQLYVDDGDLLSSAGLAAGVDLCLHVIRRDHGSAVANHVARHCVVPPWRDGGQAQFIERHVPEPDEQTTAPAREWALHHLDRRIEIAELADLSRMSVRTFNRRFREETGQPPGAWLTEQRVEFARRLLETTDLPIDGVARRSGLGTGASLRQHLRASVGTSPAAYRRTFRGAPAGTVEASP